MHSKLWLEEIKQYVSELFSFSKEEELWPEVNFSDLVIRPYLRLSSSYKKDLLNEKLKVLRDSEIITKYKCLEMPKYVWVIELARREGFAGESIFERTICGEILLDSTGNRHLPEETLISFQFDGAMFTPRRNEIPAKLLVVDDPVPYTPLQRSHPN